MYLGIDFGTSYSTLAIYVDNNKNTGLLPPLCGKRGIPTLMRFDAAMGTWCFGEDCDLVHFPSDTVRNIKAEIRQGKDIESTVQSAGKSRKYKELLKDFLSHLIKTGVKAAKENENYVAEDEQIQGVTVTVPCGFAGHGMSHSQYGQVIQEGVINAYQEVIRSGIRLAQVGNPPVSIIEEPVAAAVEYLTSTKGRAALANKSKLKILVADLGGGTFDVTVMECNGYRSFDVITKDGDLKLGGNDWDNAFLNYITGKIKQQNAGYVLTDNIRVSELLNANACKERLSDTDRQTFNSSTGCRVVISREEFEKATRHLLVRVQNIIKKCVQDAGGIDTIDKIVLVGGSCRMPQIKNGIKEIYPAFGADDIVLFEPSYSIANGAAQCSAMKHQVQVSFGSGGATNVVNDCATCTYGVDYYLTGTDDLYIRNMLFKGTKFVDGKIERQVGSYVPRREDQKVTTFTVYESSYDAQHETVILQGNNDKFNTNGLIVKVPIPPEYYNQNKSKEYSMVPRIILSSDGILILEIYHNGQFVVSNQKKLY